MRRSRVRGAVGLCVLAVALVCGAPPASAAGSNETVRADDDASTAGARAARTGARVAGYRAANGRLSPAALAPIFHPSHPEVSRLARRPAAAWNTLRLASLHDHGIDLYAQESGSEFAGSYRTMAGQWIAWQRYVGGEGALAARPETSNHGWGTAIDLAELTMRPVVLAIGPRSGWRKIEAFGEWWHFNYVGGFTRPDPGVSAAFPVARLRSGGYGQRPFVRRLQALLRRAGYGVAVTGEFAARTDALVRRFQRRESRAGVRLRTDGS